MKLLAKLHPRSQKPACVINGEVAIVHSPWFVLEIPKDKIDETIEWPGSPLDFVLQWKQEQLPSNEGEVAQPMRVRWDDEKPVIQLMSENLQGSIDPELYDFVRRHTDTPEFRLYPEVRADGSPSNIGVFSKKKPVGVMAPVVDVQDQETHGWKTSL